MRTELFDFELPEELIALEPARPRDAGRLLLIGPDRDGAPELTDRLVRDLPELLRPDDLLVLNDTRVISAALAGERERDGRRARIEVNLHKRAGPVSWLAFARPAKRLAPGDRIRFLAADGRPADVLDAVVVRKGEAGEVELLFAAPADDLDAAIERVGAMPLPPYIALRRPAAEVDRTDYQTMFARQAGAVAAPTASLHFSPALVERLDARGIERVTVTLHVGAGTFLPVKSETVEGHRMHAEWGEVAPAAAARLTHARRTGRRLVAVGTTALRLVESAAREDGAIEPFRGETAIFITPGYRFRAVDGLVTNFHLPRSTLFMLVAAFRGLEAMQGAYAHAIARRYRFYSYGDASLIWRQGTR
jgi:S-adenosylmethionine:tRNA ribosyltransferase-isomerase